jgi:uncharacterized SAM-binding protein YcdF (DUF218 family)
VLAWVAARELGGHHWPGLGSPHVVAITAVAGAALGLTRARWLTRAAGALSAALLLAVSYLLPIPRLATGWQRADTLPRLEVVVALSADVRWDGVPDARGQIRLLRAYELLGAGHARRLVITRVAPPRPSTLAAVRTQLARLGLNCPVEEVGPVTNTHDEALAVAALARKRGWKRILLVSEPLHLRRAAAVFEAAGLTPYCAPSPPHSYNPTTLNAPTTRWALFGELLHETIGYMVYRRRGWIRDDW